MAERRVAVSAVARSRALLCGHRWRVLKADFARWGCAAAEALGFGTEAFLRAFPLNNQQQSFEVIDGDPLASGILQLLEKRDEWIGSAEELLGVLTNLGVRGLPTRPDALGRRLRRLEAALTDWGVSKNGIRIPGADAGGSTTSPGFRSQREASPVSQVS